MRRSDVEKNFRMRFLELSSEGDKQLAYANTTALRTVATEKCLWLKDRRVKRACMRLPCLRRACTCPPALRLSVRARP